MPPVTAPIPALSWYQVPPDLKGLLLTAAAAWPDDAEGDRCMALALAHPQASLAVWISAYRYFFYRHNDAMAKQMAEQVIQRVEQDEQLPSHWAVLQPILRRRRLEAPIRLYLTASAALGLLLARLGDLEGAKAIASRLQSIDDDNEFGASLILSILTPPADTEEADDD
ncbi:hypothetical protein [Leptolyngbya sp. KIOST-1]|uniref:hypothetical protein n=1 Tax=Leptolyngbya sp. KIOST-1 TaxID=1229172 RepID=UPI000569B5DA|nr:hypothetical protein [Leptolyngbya sp. KIOST-1]